MLAACVVWTWATTVASQQVECLAFVDDRTFWGTSTEALLEAHDRSAQVDQLFGFQCSVKKRHVAYHVNQETGTSLVQTLQYSGNSSLEILGLFYSLSRELPQLLKSGWRKAQLRLRYLRSVPGSLKQKAHHLQSLILPLFNWA